MVLVVLLILVERVVLVDIFHIGGRLVGRVVVLRLVVGIGGVALRHVDALVALQDRLLFAVVVGSAEVVVVVIGWVGPDGVEDGLVDLASDLRQEVLVGLELALLIVGEAVEAHVLQGAAALGGGKGIGDGGLRRDAAPLCGGPGLTAIDGHSALIELLAVAEDILAHLAEVYIEVATVEMSIFALVAVDEGVEHPKLDILDVGGLEVARVQFAHHAAPLRLGLVEASVEGEVGIEVVRTTLVGIVGEVEDSKHRRLAAIVVLVALREELAGIDLAHIVVGELLQIAADMAWREGRAASREERVDIVPCEQRAIVAALERCLVARLVEETRYGGDDPGGRLRDVDGALRILEVVEVGGVVLRATGLAGDELCKLGR